MWWILQGKQFYWLMVLWMKMKLNWMKLIQVINCFHSSLFLLSIALAELISSYKKISSLSSISANEKCLTFALKCGNFMLGLYVHLEKFAYATHANSFHSRQHFILNWGARVIMCFSFFFFFFLLSPPLILHRRHIHACFEVSHLFFYRRQKINSRGKY